MHVVVVVVVFVIFDVVVVVVGKEREREREWSLSLTCSQMTNVSNTVPDNTDVIQTDLDSLQA